MAEKFRVAFNASALPPRPAGAGIYTLELARALKARDDVELLVAAPAGRWPGSHWATPTGAIARNRWEQARLPGEMRRADSDVYHGAHFATPVRSVVPRVATVHDLTFYRLGRRYDWRHRWYYKALAQTAKHAERIIVPSAAVAGDVVRYLGYPVERVRVVAEAPRAGWHAAADNDVANMRTRLSIQGQYLLMAGTSEPGKRAVDGVRAVAMLRERAVNAKLVLAGNAGRLDGRLRDEAVRLGVADRVLLTGYVTDEELRVLYTGASALLFVSLYEGF
ncbi:MAG TPA: glycosyltransferase family 1 protein, partial [Tepidiformaceae bacterium]|nr:glycosyltransferase family 1 protein [Tepidiformaceae bacterium]